MSKQSKVTKVAKKDDEFIKAYKESGQKVPGIFSGDFEQAIFASVYVGYLLGTVGGAEADRIYDEITG